MKEAKNLSNFLKELLVSLSFIVILILLIGTQIVSFTSSGSPNNISFFEIIFKEAAIYNGNILIFNHTRYILISSITSLLVSLILFIVGFIYLYKEKEKFSKYYYSFSILFLLYFIFSTLFTNQYFISFNKNSNFDNFEINALLSCGLIILSVFISLLLISKIIGKIEYSIQEICETSILVGLAVVLDFFVKIPIQANGGSISFAPIPLFIIAIRYGGFKGFIASGLFFGLITCLLDGYGFQTFPFDYFIALSGYGLVGTFVNFFNRFNKSNITSKQVGLTIVGVIVGGILATVVRYIGHMISGFILYAPISFIDNFIYQSTYIPLTMLISIVSTCVLAAPIILINKVFKVKHAK